MKRRVGVLCFALAFPGLLAAGPAARPQVPARPSTISRAIGGLVSLLRAHWRIRPADGGHEPPPPTPPPPIQVSSPVPLM